MLRKISVIVLLAAFVFGGFAVHSEAARRTFADALSVDVPGGWKVDEEIGDDLAHIIFTAPDDSAVAIVIVGESEGFTAAEFAYDLSEEWGGSEPEEDEDGDFLFSFQNENGVDGVAFISVMEDIVIAVLRVGDHPQMNGLLSSFQPVQ